MSEFPTPALVAKIKMIILATFDVPESEAQTYADSFAMLAEDSGSPQKAATLDWHYRVKKDLGEKLKWKSDAEREAFRKQQEDNYRAYDFLIRRPNRA